MKKFLSLILAIILILSLCACGKETAESTDEGTTANTESSTTNTDGTTESNKQPDETTFATNGTEENTSATAGTQAPTEDTKPTEKPTEQTEPTKPTEPSHKHSYDGNVTENATCTEKGTKTFTCSCGSYYTESISATGHSWGEWKTTKEPTSTTEGNSQRKCNKCGVTENKSIPKVNIPSTMELKKVGNLQYYLYTPSNPTSNMPLIIYLHGGTNKKADVTALLTTEGFPKYLYDGYYGNLRAYVAIPKLDNSYKGWVNVSSQIRDLIKTLNTNYAIDMGKIALTGHSMGGTGTYQLQTKLSNTFACIAPMSGSIQNTQENLTALSKTKIWAFIGTEDTIVSPDSSREIIKALKEKGANAKITELNGATHFDVPSLAYKNPDLIQWLVDCGK